jgi:hypothetical protein
MTFTVTHLLSTLWSDAQCDIEADRKTEAHSIEYVKQDENQVAASTPPHILLSHSFCMKE